MPVEYTLITSGGRRTTVEGYLSEVIESQKGRKTSVGIYWKNLLIATVYQGEVIFAL